MKSEPSASQPSVPSSPPTSVVPLPPESPRTGLVSLAEFFPPLSLPQVFEQVELDHLRAMAGSLLRGRSEQTRNVFRGTDLVHQALQRSSGNFHPAKGWNDLRHFNNCFWQAMRWTLDDQHATGAHKCRLRTDYLEELYSGEFDLAEERAESAGMDILDEFKERDSEGFELLLNYKGNQLSLGRLVNQHILVDQASAADNPQKAAEKKLSRKLAILLGTLRAEGRRRGLKVKEPKQKN